MKNKKFKLEVTVIFRDDDFGDGTMLAHSIKNAIERNLNFQDIKVKLVHKYRR